MRLEVNCKSCKEKFNIKDGAISRPDLIHSVGEYFYKRCLHCGSQNEYHVNEVKARNVGNLPGIICGILVIIFVTIFYWNAGWITNVGFILGLGIIGASNASVLTSTATAFNKYYVDATERD